MRIKNAVFKLISLTLPVYFLVCVPRLPAQQVQPQEYQSQEPGEKEPSHFSDPELKKFARLKSEVDEITKRFGRAFGRVDEPNKARKLQDRYLQQIVDTIRAEGLSVEKYNEVSRAAERNPELQKKIEQMAE